jgi:hypothetical protein
MFEHKINFMVDHEIKQSEGCRALIGVGHEVQALFPHPSADFTALSLRAPRQSGAVLNSARVHYFPRLTAQCGQPFNFGEFPKVN